jgi:hypothetical protein
MNKCMDDCTNRATGYSDVIYSGWQGGKIPDPVATSQLDRCSKVHDYCCDQCVPHRRHFTDPQKESFQGNALVESGFGTGLALAGVGVAAAATGPAGIAAAAIIYACGAFSIGMGWKDALLYNEPIDPNFSKIPVLSIPRLLVVRPVRNSGLSASVARAANAVLTNQAETIGLMNALITALDRSDGAAKAGDASAEQRQLNAARDFAKKISASIKNSASLRLTLASKWPPGMDVAISEQDAQKMRDGAILDGFPSPFLDQLKKLGIDGLDRDSVLQDVIIDLATPRSIPGFRALLVDPKWRAADLQLASTLTQFTRSQ